MLARCKWVPLIVLLFAGFEPLLLAGQTERQQATTLATTDEKNAVAKNCPTGRKKAHLCRQRLIRQGPAPSPSVFWYGTDRLCTVLSKQWQWRPHGPGHENDLTAKLFWWRDGYDWRSQNGRLPLEVSGRRLDGQAPPMEVDHASGSHNATWKSFMVMGAWVPTPGCREIQGNYRGELKFVFWIAPE
jgi:hypothetical protein